MTTLDTQHPVAVLGAGPVGLAAAAHLVSRGLTPLVLEAGDEVAASFRSVAHVRLFSPWRYNLDRAARQLLEAQGWTPPDLDALPTAGALVDDYLTPLAAHPALQPHMRFGARVESVSRQGLDKVKTDGRAGAPFVIRTVEDGVAHEYLAAAVIDATGTWQQPNPAGADGRPALGEIEARARIAYGMPDVAGAMRARYRGRRVLVLGAGHSAAGSLLALARLANEEPATRIVWAVRGASLTRIFGGGDRDGLPARGALGADLAQLEREGRLEVHLRFQLREIVPHGDALRLVGHARDGVVPQIDGIDEVIVATGARPDVTMWRELRVRLDPWLESTEALAPLIDPNVHSCGTVRPHGHRELAHPEPGFYVIGAKSYGRAPNFLMATGYEQARSVVAALAGDLAAADDVQLELPETGVCSTDLAPAAACCGTAPAPAASCGDTCGVERPAPAAAGCCG
ncbi:MAG: NAD(P)-binding domain-containing protein [Vicinamibacterales bacterium]|nr:NAD(P)-binding domain-containing protein [Vicinamibacterales bacterium]